MMNIPVEQLNSGRGEVAALNEMQENLQIGLDLLPIGFTKADVSSTPGTAVQQHNNSRLFKNSVIKVTWWLGFDVAIWRHCQQRRRLES